MTDWLRSVRDAVGGTRSLVSTWQARAAARPVTPAPAGLDVDLALSHDLDELAERVARVLEDGTLHASNPSYHGLFVPPAHEAGVVADLLAATFNPQLGATWHAPAATEIERSTLRYLGALIGFAGPRVHAAFTSGGSEANFSAVTTALARAFPDALRDGLPRAGRPVMIASAHAHDSFVKIARQTGLGERAVLRVAADEQQRMDVGAARRCIARARARGERPFALVATAGTTATGAIDPLHDLAELARREDLWLHVDAAWGGIAALHRGLRTWLEGIELADSVTWDAHKTLPIPVGTGMIFTRERRWVERAFAVQTGYVPAADADDAYRTSVQWSRRFAGLKVFMTLAQLGAGGIEDMVARQLATADELRRRLRARGWAIRNRTPLPLVCFSRQDLDAEAAAAHVVDSGRAWISSVQLPEGPRWLRACITHPQTGSEHIEALLEALPS